MVTKVEKPADAPAASQALESLASQADALGAPPAEGGGPTGPPQQVELSVTERNEKAVGFALAALALTAQQLFDIHALAKAWTPATIPGLAGPWAEVFTHYGVDLGGALDHPLAKALVLTGLPLAAVGREAVAEWRHKRGPRKALEGEGEGAAPGPAPAVER